MGRKKVRVVQVVVQPTLVVDDGETLAPLSVSAITVAAADWPTFSAERWPALLAEAEAEVNADTPA